MNKFLFFQNADNDCNVYPLTKLKSVEGEDDALKFTFDVAGGVDTISVLLEDDSDELVAMREVAEAINAHPHGDGVIVVGDDANTKFAMTAFKKDGNAVGAAG
tara:strand:- start:49 stop:357 length:309 start_codon:yes stop_codon:yes gene_type:complete